jgi:hypothetical protein
MVAITTDQRRTGEISAEEHELRFQSGLSRGAGVLSSREN